MPGTKPEQHASRRKPLLTQAQTTLNHSLNYVAQARLSDKSVNLVPDSQQIGENNVSQIEKLSLTELNLFAH